MILRKMSIIIYPSCNDVTYYGGQSSKEKIVFYVSCVENILLKFILIAMYHITLKQSRTILIPCSKSSTFNYYTINKDFNWISYYIDLLNIDNFRKLDSTTVEKANQKAAKSQTIRKINKNTNSKVRTRLVDKIITIKGNQNSWGPASNNKSLEQRRIKRIRGFDVYLYTSEVNECPK